MQQLLRCQTKEQCLVLDADVRKRGTDKPHADKSGQGTYTNRYFLHTFFVDHPKKGAGAILYKSSTMTDWFIRFTVVATCKYPQAQRERVWSDADGGRQRTVRTSASYYFFIISVYFADDLYGRC